MNNITLAHVGGELVIIGGVAFYFHRKTKSLETELEELKRQTNELKAVINDMQDTIQQLGSMVVRQSQTQSQTQTQRSKEKEYLTVPPKVSQQSMARQPVSKPPRRKQVKKNDSDDSGSETLDDADLDRELATEFKKLNQERSRIECNNDVCELVED